MEFLDRIQAPTPKWWKKVRNVMFVVAGVSGALLTLPVSLPVGVVTALTYTAVISGTIAGTAQATKDDKVEEKKKKEDDEKKDIEEK
jgi:uncharacterized membrane protein